MGSPGSPSTSVLPVPSVDCSCPSSCGSDASPSPSVFIGRVSSGPVPSSEPF